MRITTAISVIALSACGTSSESEVSNDLAFHGEHVVLPGFSKDTGLQPAGSPVQLQLTFSAGGAITADAHAIAGGSGDGTKVAGVPGSGLFKLDAHIKAAAMLHVAVSGFNYDGPVPGIENLDITFAGETAFDPFLLDGGKAQLEVKIPEIKLPPIPLPGGIPGSLNLTIADGSVVRTALAGTCAGVDGKAIQFLAKTTTGGSVVVKSEIIIKVPIVGDKAFPIPAFTIDIPGVDVDMDLGTQAFAGGGDAPTGSSFAKPGACSAAPGGPGDPNNPTGGTCKPESSYVSQYHPPVRAALCSGSQLSSFNTVCLSQGSTAETCAAFKTNPANTGCYGCLVTPDTAPGYGPFIRYKATTQANIAGCIVLADPSQLACAKQVQDLFGCLAQACSTCSDSTTEDACEADAAATVCAAYADPADACLSAVQTGPAASCLTDIDQYPARFCGP